MKLIIISNCQVQPFSVMMSSMQEIEKVVSVPIHLEGSQFFETSKKEMFDILNNYPDTNILTINLSDNFNELSTKNLKSKYSNVKTFTNVYFDGLHPDCTYLSEMGDRILSPIGDYHSKIAIISFLKGYSITDCLEKYNSSVYEKLGYYDYFDNSYNELINRDEQLDIKLGRNLYSCFKSKPSMFTFNHPTSEIFSVCIHQLAQSIGLLYPNALPQFEQNFLSDNSWFPIYPEISEFHKLGYTGSYIFRSPNYMGGKFFNLKEFVYGSYENYKLNRQKLIESRQWMNLVELSDI